MSSLIQLFLVDHVFFANILYLIQFLRKNDEIVSFFDKKSVKINIFVGNVI